MCSKALNLKDLVCRLKVWRNYKLKKIISDIGRNLSPPWISIRYLSIISYALHSFDTFLFYV